MPALPLFKLKPKIILIDYIRPVLLYPHAILNNLNYDLIMRAAARLHLIHGVM